MNVVLCPLSYPEQSKENCTLTYTACASDLVSGPQTVSETPHLWRSFLARSVADAGVHACFLN